jgi:hypothetical protein
MIETLIFGLTVLVWGKIFSLIALAAIAMYLSYRLSEFLISSIDLRRDDACQ